MQKLSHTVCNVHCGSFEKFPGLYERIERKYVETSLFIAFYGQIQKNYNIISMSNSQWIFNWKSKVNKISIKNENVYSVNATMHSNALNSFCWSKRLKIFRRGPFEFADLGIVQQFLFESMLPLNVIISIKLSINDFVITNDACNQRFFNVHWPNLQDCVHNIEQTIHARTLHYLLTLCTLVFIKARP